MEVIELERRATGSGEMITEYKAGKQYVQLVGSFDETTTLDDLLYSIASQKIAERYGQKRGNIVLTG